MRLMFILFGKFVFIFKILRLKRGSIENPSRIASGYLARGNTGSGKDFTYDGLRPVERIWCYVPIFSFRSKVY